MQILPPWTGHTPVFDVTKYGRNTNVDATATDLWDLTTQPIWLAPTASRIHAIVSADTDDNGSPVGTGARTIKIYGLKSFGKGESEITEIVTLNGTTPVNTKSSYAIIYRMKVINWGSAGPNAGIIKATAASDSTITAQILAGAGQTQMCIFGVPEGQTLKMWEAYADMNRQGGLTPLADISLLSNDMAGTIPDKFRIRQTWGLIATGDSAIPIEWPGGKTFAGPSIIKLQAIGSTTDLDISAGFDGTIYNNQ